MFHPGGKLGAQLLTVTDVMGRGGQRPAIGLDASADAMRRNRSGSTAVVDLDGRPVTACAKANLRHAITSASLDETIVRHGTVRPLAAGATLLAPEAVRAMNDNAVLLLFACNDGCPISAVCSTASLRADVV